METNSTPEPGTVAQVAVLPMCDLHKTLRGTEVPAHYDAKLKTGTCWAFLCDECFAIHGVGLGTGRGQRLEVVK